LIFEEKSMKQELKKPEYLLLIRGTDWDKDLSPEQLQGVMGRFTLWCDKLGKDGKLKGAQPLEDRGKVVTGKNGQTVSDGPFVESKEAVGGYFLLTVSGEEEAVKIAQACPLLNLGLAVEVRPVAEECLLLQQFKTEPALAAV
jgi:hypothetical protein